MELQERIKKLFQQWSGAKAEKLEPLPASGSMRRYFRIRGEEKVAIAAFNPDAKENRAFLGFTEQFRTAGLPVPQIYATDLKAHIYLLEDLGDETLYGYITKIRNQRDAEIRIKEIYEKIVRLLPAIQIKGGQHLDPKLCYPRARFDKQSMMWDLNYFKYYFLKLAGILYDEQALEKDFVRMVRFLGQAEATAFMYRDFQSRNLMLRDKKVFLIDYQGGRRGPLQYDLASLLWDAKADLRPILREELIAVYLDELRKYNSVAAESFLDHFYSFVYIRIMQAMGAYGFRGFYERKEHFLLSVPYAVANLRWLLEHHPFPIPLPELERCLNSICASDAFSFITENETELVVTVNSFSYKNGLPRDLSGNGGGFVFDCRALPNPGRFSNYRDLTGKDEPVQQFFEKEESVHLFFGHARSLVFQAIENYLERGFTRLMVSFGCTGGQHRSVWSAERMTAEIRKKFNVKVKLTHRELNSSNASKQ